LCYKKQKKRSKEGTRERGRERERERERDRGRAKNVSNKSRRGIKPTREQSQHQNRLKRDENHILITLYKYGEFIKKKNKHI